MTRRARQAYGDRVLTIFRASFLLLPLLLAARLDAAYQIDFARWFPPVDVQRRELDSALRALETCRGRVTRSPAALAAALTAYGRAEEKVERLDAYLYLRYAVDTTNVASLHEEEALSGAFAQRTAFMNHELKQASRERMRHLLASPIARPFTYFVNEVRRTGSRLTVAEEQIVDRLSPLVGGWPYELYDELSSRKEESRDLYAFALLGLVRGRTELAHLRAFHDAATEVYSAAGLTRGDTERLFSEVAHESATYREFLKSQPADTPETKPLFTLEETPALLRDALRPLGDDYGLALSRLLDPREARMDIMPGPHRKRGGFSKGFPGMTSVFFMNGFTGAWNDLRIIAHEGTHAVQRQMEADAGVPAVYMSGPKYVMEGVALTAELILADHLATNATESARRQYFRRQLLERALSSIFETAAEGDLEERIYDLVERGTLRTAKDLDELTVATFARYGIATDPGHWTKIRLLFEDPFYDVNYSWAETIALVLFAQYRAEPEAFGRRYSSAMGKPFAQPPAAWLRDAFGIDLSDPALVPKALAAIRPDLESLTKR